jgi:hypothetical protein
VYEKTPMVFLVVTSYPWDTRSWNVIKFACFLHDY